MTENDELRIFVLPSYCTVNDDWQECAPCDTCGNPTPTGQLREFDYPFTDLDEVTRVETLRICGTCLHPRPKLEVVR